METETTRLYDWTKIHINSEVHQEAAYWCSQNIGEQWEAISERAGIWTCFWRGIVKEYEFSFKYEEDAVRFALRWK